MNAGDLPMTRSGWPWASAVRETAVLLVALVLVAALAEGDLVTWLSAALILIYAFWGRGNDSSHDVPLAAILIPLFIATIIASVIADGEWFYVAIVALCVPLFVLTRLVLSRREPRHPADT